MGATRPPAIAAVDHTTWYRASGPADVDILLGDVLRTRRGFVLAPDAIPPAVGCPISSIVADPSRRAGCVPNGAPR